MTWLDLSLEQFDPLTFAPSDVLLFVFMELGRELISFKLPVEQCFYNIQRRMCLEINSYLDYWCSVDTELLLEFDTLQCITYGKTSKKKLIFIAIMWVLHNSALLSVWLYTVKGLSLSATNTCIQYFYEITTGSSVEQFCMNVILYTRVSKHVWFENQLTLQRVKPLSV